MEPGPLLRLEAVTKVFSAEDVETHALAGVDLSVERGEFVSIAGPSGCGKTTLLSILGLLDVPTGGSCLFDGRDVGSSSATARAELRARAVGFVFQSFNLIGDLTVRENVALPLSYRDFTPAERRARVDEALERVGLAHRGRHRPAQLSGGQQQRVAVARAVAGRPAVLLADEPTGNLDSRSGDAVLELLADLHAGGTTLCIVTHDVRYARYAAREVQLFDGRVVGEGAVRR